MWLISGIVAEAARGGELPILMQQSTISTETEIWLFNPEKNSCCVG
jgi:hypothetical protein